MNTNRPLQRTLAAAALALAAAAAVAAPGMGPGGMMGMGPGMHMAGPGGMGMGMGMGMGPGMMGGGRHGEQMLTAINATPDQKARIKAIMEAARNDLRAQHDARHALHEQARQVFAAPTVDPAAAEALRQQMLAQHDQASKRMMQAMLEASQVLTPEQRQQLSQQMAARHEAMQHRHEQRGARPGK
jgi:Spy/CpxP family protein refolding chaperone